MELEKLFYPKSIAVVGASRDPKKLGNIVIKNLLASGYEGVLYPINPEAQEIYSIKVYAGYDQVPETPELAVIVVPAVVAMQLLPLIADKGTKHVVILSAGFKEEHGTEGAEREMALKQMAEERGLVVLGPNCLGLLNTEHKMNATFGQVVNDVGNLRFVSQSGAIATSLFDYAAYCGLGFSQFVTLGNKAVVSENEVLQFWLDERATRAEKTEWKNKGMSPYQPVGMYLESIEHGREFLEIAREMVKSSPLFILKPGKSQGAAEAMKSHTGAMAGEDAVLDAALSQVGVIRCDGIEDVFDFARLFSWEVAPKGARVAVVSNAGGPAVMSADAVEESGLVLADLQEKTKKILLEKLPRAASIHNPVDVLGDALADRYAAAVKAVFEDGGVDAVVVILTPQVMTQIEETAEVIGQLSKEYPDKTLVCAFMGGTLVSHGEQVLNGYRIPSFRYPERAIRALGKMHEWAMISNKMSENKEVGFMAPVGEKVGTRTVERIIAGAQNVQREILTPIEVNAIFRAAEIAVPVADTVEFFEDAKLFVRKHRGWPVVVKLSSAEAYHKTELGGVITNVGSFKQLGEAITVMKHIASGLREKGDATAEVMIQKQVDKGVELILGVKKDPSFGHVLLLGVGGTMANLIHDRNLFVLPASRDAIDELIKKSKVYPVLQGFRGDKGYAVEKLGDLIARFVDLAQSYDDIVEMEINPVIVTRRSAWAVDGKGRVRSKKGS